MDIFVYLFLVSTYIFLYYFFFRKNVASFYHILEKINIILTVDGGRDTYLRFSNIHFFHLLHILSDLILGIHTPAIGCLTFCFYCFFLGFFNSLFHDCTRTSLTLLLVYHQRQKVFCDLSVIVFFLNLFKNIAPIAQKDVYSISIFYVVGRKKTAAFNKKKNVSNDYINS